ncbi:MAG: FAD-dependent oxidoreductase, partial [Shewanella sp.]
LPIKCVSHVKLFAKQMVNDYEQATIEEFTTEEIEALVQKFVRAAVLAQQAGCDGVGIHGGHAYLINQFFAKGFNKRKDRYGGSFTNRVRFAVEVVTGIKAACGSDFPIIFRLAARDFLPLGMGLSAKTVQKIVRTLTAAGVDLFDLTGGIDVANKKSMCVEPQGYAEAFRAHYAQPVTANSSVPISTVGVIKSPEVADGLIRAGVTDFVTLGRALICDPYWPQKAEQGDAMRIRKCLSCNEGCFAPIIQNIHKPVTCALNPRVSREANDPLGTQAATKKRVVIVGAGPAGAQAALTAAERGHEVIVFEQGKTSGGQLRLAAVPPGKDFVKDALTWYQRELELHPQITVHYQTAATAASIMAVQPEHIILAMGAKPFTPPIPGVESTIHAWDILEPTTAAPKKQQIAIIGGGIVGAETAHYLAEQGNKVTIVELNAEIAQGMEPYNQIVLRRELKALKVKQLTQAKVQTITATGLTYEHKGKTKNLKADHVVMALGQRPVGTNLKTQLEPFGVPIVTIGDMNRVGKIIQATESGYFAALDI